MDAGGTIILQVDHESDLTRPIEIEIAKIFKGVLDGALVEIETGSQKKLRGLLIYHVSTHIYRTPYADRSHYNIAVS